ncbi:MAG TPA: hypothetical protein PLF96_13830, partial [Thermotogota bacterium]|nr:hypothetical protein [Thermotogota bacterium]
MKQKAAREAPPIQGKNLSLGKIGMDSAVKDQITRISYEKSVNLRKKSISMQFTTPCASLLFSG